jgi:hypothetical protein
MERFYGMTRYGAHLWVDSELRVFQEKWTWRNKLSVTRRRFNKHAATSFSNAVTLGAELSQRACLAVARLTLRTTAS